MINIDSRACGAGKTVGPTGIVSRIEQLYNLGQYCLVVLPGHKIIDEYKKYLQFVDPVDIEFIDARSHTNTSESVAASIGNRTQIIVTTHQTFIQTVWYSPHKRDYNLFIDEELKTIEQTKVWQKKTNAFNFFDANISSLRDIEQSNIFAPGWRIMDVSRRVIENNFINDVIKDLTDDNWLNWVELDQYESLSNGATGGLDVIRELRPELLCDWNSVHIACAAFHTTFMRFWLDAHKHSWSVLSGCDFEPHATPVTLHYPLTNNPVIWSLNKITNDHWMLDAYREYIDTLQVIDEVLVLRNVKDRRKGVFDNETLAPFNSHGLNSYRHITKVSLEAAINLTPELNRWYKQHWDMNDRGEIGGRSNDILIARTGNTFYQTLMRCCLRLDQPADVYTLDARLATDILHVYFDDITFVDIDFCNKEPKTALTPAEKQKAYRQRKKQEKLNAK